MLFGIDRVSNRIHTLATLLVAFGTSMSAFWIIALNSWMHTPAGYEMRNGVAFPIDWWAIIFNPSMPYRLAHMVTASGLTAGFLIAGISAYRILKGDHKPAPRRALKVAVFASAMLIPLQIFLGDMHGLNTLQHQPAKIAAMEGLWHTEKGAPLVLFAIPDEKTQSNKFSIEIPRVASFVLTHDLNGEIKGLNEFPNAHPPVKPVFFGFRVMVSIGMLMLAVTWLGCWQYWRRKELSPLMLKVFVGMTFSGWIATLAGWYVTEIGRQPYLVTGILKTVDAVTLVPSSNVGISFAIYLMLYAALLFAYVRTLFVMARKAVLVDRTEEIQTLQEKLFAAQTPILQASTVGPNT
jgi:cytochrome d ubiquinol oxidase subunit I